MLTNLRNFFYFILSNQSVYFLSHSLAFHIFSFLIIIMLIPLHVKPVVKLPSEKVLLSVDKLLGLNQCLS